MVTVLPTLFIENIQKELGSDFQLFNDSLKLSAPVSVRINPSKRTEQFKKDEKIAWCEEGRYLPQRPSFTFDPLFHAGCYYVQEASSMLIEQVYKKINPENKTLRTLDLCAAPGGKSTHLLSLMNNDSLLVSNEIIPNRNTVLQQNLVKWGFPNAIVTQNNPADFKKLKSFFDLIVVDAPCSGEGLFRKDKHAIAEWSPENVERCVIRQESILRDIIPSLKPGGVLIYSTCTYEKAENDFQIEKAIKNYDLELIDLSDIAFDATITEFGLQCYPHKIKGEGFYISALRKKEEEHSENIKSNFKTNAQLKSYLEDFLEEPGNFEPLLVNDTLFALPKSLIPVYDLISSSLYVRQAGVCIGTIKGKDLVPAHDLALSNALRNEIFSITLNEDDAIRFLKCESIPSVNVEPGWYTANYDSFPLGWVKVLTNRVNNYFPRNWRILKDVKDKIESENISLQ